MDTDQLRAKKLLKQILNPSNSAAKREVEAEESDSQIERADRLRLIKNLKIQIRDLTTQLNFIDTLLRQELTTDESIKLQL